MILNLYSYYTHTSIWKRKRAAKAHQLSSLPPELRAPPDAEDRAIVGTPAAQIVAHAHAGEWAPQRILQAFTRAALEAHAATNCLSEILVSSPSTSTPAGHGAEIQTTTPLPLYGLPVSLKDSIDVAGFDSTNGYSRAAFAPARADSALVRLLKDAGAQVYVKTNVPTSLLSFDCRNDLHGVSLNPHGLGLPSTSSASASKDSASPSASSGSFTSSELSSTSDERPGRPLIPGGSGGEAALLAALGSRIGIGTDIAGSVRVPAHFCGIFSLRSSFGRFPRAPGIQSSLPGQEGVQGIAAPMARTLEDLRWFWERVVGCGPWRYDCSCNEIPWRSVDYLAEGRKLKFGVMWDDGLVRPTPACRRALADTVDRLRKSGHEVVNFVLPNAPEALIIGWSLLLADGGATLSARLHAGEFLEPGVVSLLRIARLPRLLRRAYALYLSWRGEGWYADLVRGMGAKSVADIWQLTVRRNTWRQQAADALDAAQLDFVLCAPSPTPAPPAGRETGKALLLACGLTFLWNIADYSAGVLPVSTISPSLDSSTLMDKPRNIVEKRLYAVYDPSVMRGAPIGVQVVGRRLEEEKVLAAMAVVQDVWGRGRA